MDHSGFTVKKGKERNRLYVIDKKKSNIRKKEEENKAIILYIRYLLTS